LHVEDNKIKDSDGRERIYHGTNVVNKMFPYVPKTDKFDAAHSYSREDAQFLADLGYNTIRLGVLWAGAEPQEGQYN
jgi:endoglycosylceramidase